MSEKTKDIMRSIPIVVLVAAVIFLAIHRRDIALFIDQTGHFLHCYPDSAGNCSLTKF